jgi:hypothetical protein
MSRMRTLTSGCLFCWPLSFHGQTPDGPVPVTAVRSARMLDVKIGEYVLNAVVLIQNGRILDAVWVL